MRDSPNSPEAWPDALLIEAQVLLEAARRTLSGATRLPPRRRTRAAALFARGALERLVDAHLARHQPLPAEVTMRVKLVCLRTLGDADTANAAAAAWVGLSSGCHQHAYELSPTWAEVKHHVQLTEILAERLLASAEA